MFAFLKTLARMNRKISGQNRSEEDGCRISPEDLLVEAELVQDQGHAAHWTPSPVPSACRVSSR